MIKWSDIASDQAVECLRFHLTSGIGPYRFNQLVNHLGGVGALRHASRDAVGQVPGIGPKTFRALRSHVPDCDVEAELLRVQKFGARILCRFDRDYPNSLRHIPDAPVCLYCFGDVPNHWPPMISVVGSRRCTRYGQEQAYTFAMALARMGLGVVSGLAQGADTQAHRGALDGAGMTVAVLGCGLHALCDHANAQLAQTIVDRGGCVISELSMSSPAAPQNFPVRNRIIAGISLGTLVVEAARRSGSLITARLALEYDREVFSIPGRIDVEQANGTNQLIQAQRAKLVTCVADIVQDLAHAANDLNCAHTEHVSRKRNPLLEQMQEDERQIFDLMDSEAVDLEHICLVTELPPQKISHALMRLQLIGAVEQLPGNRFASLISDSRSG